MAAPTITYLEDEEMIEKCGHDFKMITGQLAFGAYETNGVAFDLSKKIPTKVHHVIFDQPAGYVLAYDYTNKKIKVFMGDYAQTDDQPLTEVDDTTDLSTPLASVRFTAIGK